MTIGHRALETERGSQEHVRQGRNTEGSIQHDMKMVLIFMGLVALLGAVAVIAVLTSGGGSAGPSTGGNGKGTIASTAPKEMDFPALMGHVIFDHALHSKREKENCKACHDNLFPESAAPLNYKAAEHRIAETKRSSCAGCHFPGGSAFETKGHCAQCHIRR